MKITFGDKDSFQDILRRVYGLFLDNTTPDFKSARSRPTGMVLKFETRYDIQSYLKFRKIILL